jgi:hypothetical protein
LLPFCLLPRSSEWVCSARIAWQFAGRSKDAGAKVDTRLSCLALWEVISTYKRFPKQITYDVHDSLGPHRSNQNALEHDEIVRLIALAFPLLILLRRIPQFLLAYIYHQPCHLSSDFESSHLTQQSFGHLAHSISRLIELPRQRSIYCDKCKAWKDLDHPVSGSFRVVCRSFVRWSLDNLKSSVSDFFERLECFFPRIVMS